MPHSLSSSKRNRQNAVRQQRNQIRKSRLKTQIAKLNEAVHDRKIDAAVTLLGQTAKLLDQTAAKGTIHRNAAARKKSRLAKSLNKMKAGGPALTTKSKSRG